MFTFPCPQSAACAAACLTGWSRTQALDCCCSRKKPDVTTELICLSMFTVSEYSPVQFNNTQNNCNYKNLSHIKSSFCNFFTEQLQIIGFKNGAVSVGEPGRGSGRKQQKNTHVWYVLWHCHNRILHFYYNGCAIYYCDCARCITAGVRKFFKTTFLFGE